MCSAVFNFIPFKTLYLHELKSTEDEPLFELFMPPESEGKC